MTLNEYQHTDYNNGIKNQSNILEPKAISIKHMKSADNDFEYLLFELIQTKVDNSNTFNLIQFVTVYASPSHFLNPLNWKLEDYNEFMSKSIDNYNIDLNSVSVKRINLDK